jgi:hypothetical protein
MSKDVLVAKATTDNRALGLPDGCFDQMEGLIDRSAQLGGFDWSWEMKFDEVRHREGPNSLG